MEQIPCFYCGGFFDPSPRHKNQSACKQEKCQKAKRAAWQRHNVGVHGSEVQGFKVPFSSLNCIWNAY